MSAKALLSDSAALAILKQNVYLKNCTHWIESYAMGDLQRADLIKDMKKSLKAAEDNIAKMKSILQTEFNKQQLNSQT